MYFISTPVIPDNGYSGSISPANPTVMHGDDITTNIKVNPYYHLSELIVNGIPVQPATSCFFGNVTGNHKVQAIIKSNALNIREINKRLPETSLTPQIITNGEAV